MKWLVDNDVMFAAINTAHEKHTTARRWLDSSRREGWGVTVETFLACVRLLMNPAVMQGYHLPVREALRAVRAEFRGARAGAIVFGGIPVDGFLTKATGHKQVMDFYLVQAATVNGAKLATFDGGMLAAWPGIAHAVE